MTATGETSGLLLDGEAAYRLKEFSDFCGVSMALLTDMVHEGVLLPRGAAPEEWLFCGADVKRVQIALRLERDLGVNLPGAALALELLAELAELRQRLR